MDNWLNIAKASVGVLCVVLIFLFFFVDTGKIKIKNLNKILTGFLFFLCFVSSVCFFSEKGIYRPFGVFWHDVFVSYIGAKYFKDFGYKDIVNCSVVARYENNDIARDEYEKTILDPFDYSSIPIKEIVAKKDVYKSYFSDRRWQEYKHDIDYIDSKEPNAEKRIGFLRDGGFSGTPVFGVIFGSIVNYLPVKWVGTVVHLSNLILLLFILIFIYVLYGMRILLLAVSYFFIEPTSSFYVITFFRLDCICLVFACVYLSKHYHNIYFCVISAMLFALASFIKIYPFFFCLPLCVKYALDIINKREISYCVTFYSIFAIVCAFLFSFSLIFSYQGMKDWKDFFQKSDNYVKWRTQSTNFMGLKNFIIFSDNMLSNNTNKEVGDISKKSVESDNSKIQSAVLLVAKIFSILFLLFIARAFMGYQLIPYGMFICYIFFNMNPYYYILLILPLLFYAEKNMDMLSVIGLTSIFAYPILRHTLIFLAPEISRHYFCNNLILLSIFVYYIIFLALRSKTNMTQQNQIAANY